MRNICLKIYETNTAKFLSVPRLASFKKGLSKIRSFNRYQYVINGRGGICHSTYRYAKANNKYMKDYDKNKEPSYL